MNPFMTFGMAIRGAAAHSEMSRMDAFLVGPRPSFNIWISFLCGSSDIRLIDAVSIIVRIDLS